jgi:hypothetical protein
VLPQVSDLSLPNGSRSASTSPFQDARWAIEIDVHPDHILLEGTTRDKRRDRQCHLIGWQIERVTEVDLIDLQLSWTSWLPCTGRVTRRRDF